MKKLFLLFSMMALAFNASAQNYLTIEDVRVCPGRSAEVVVKYHFDSKKICAYQFDLQFPQDLAQKFAANLSSAANGATPSTFVINNNNLGNGHVRFATYSYKNDSGNETGNEPITNDEGVLLTFTVNADASLPISNEYTGNGYDANADKLIFAGNDGTQFDLSDIAFKILSYLLGDVNVDGVVDVADYLAVANRILEKTPARFVEVAANVYEDKKIDVADYLGVANIILKGNTPNNSKSAMKSPKRYAPTDIAQLDDCFYIEPIAAAPGKQKVLSIRMKNKAEVAGFQFDLRLPEGITFAKDEDGLAMAELSEERTTSKKTSSFSSEIFEDGTLRVLCGTTNANPNTGFLYTFEGNDGEVARITINIPDDYPEGDYPLYFSNAVTKDADPDGVKVEIGTVECVLTIDKNAGFVDLFETAEVAPEDAEGADVRVYRTFTDGEWSTICLPFAMTEEQVKSAFGEGTEIGDFTQWEAIENEKGDISVINVSFDPVTDIKANHPYIIKTTAATCPFVVEGVNIEVEEEPAVEVKHSTRIKSYMYGTYVANTVVPELALFLANNKFWYSTGNTKMKAFRAYFEIFDVLSSVENAGAKISFIFDGTPTSIQGVSTLKESNDEIYSVSGMNVGKDASRLQRGVYIMNGKKVVKK